MNSDRWRKFTLLLLGLTALLIGVPGTVLFLPFSLISLTGLVVDLFHQDIELSDGILLFLFGIFGTGGIVAYWAALILVFLGQAKQPLKIAIFMFLVTGVMLAISLQIWLGVAMSIYLMPVILAGILNTIGLYWMPVETKQNNNAFNTDAGKAGAG